MSRQISASPAEHRMCWGVAFAAAALVLTACSSSDAPAAEPSTTSAAAQVSGLPQVTLAAPLEGTTPDGTTDEAGPPAAAPSTATNPADGADPASNTAPITPVDPALYSAYGDQVGWKSPSGNVFCKIGPVPSSSGCQSANAPVPAGAEADCAPNSTFSVDMLSKGFYLDPGKVTPTCFNQGIFGVENARTLEYDTSIAFDGFTCYSRVEAMICDAGDGHGFVLSMQQATWN